MLPWPPRFHRQRPPPPRQTSAAPQHEGRLVGATLTSAVTNAARPGVAPGKPAPQLKHPLELVEPDPPLQRHQGQKSRRPSIEDTAPPFPSISGAACALPIGTARCRGATCRWPTVVFCRTLCATHRLAFFWRRSFGCRSGISVARNFLASGGSIFPRGRCLSFTFWLSAASARPLPVPPVFPGLHWGRMVPWGADHRRLWCRPPAREAQKVEKVKGV